MEIIHNGIEISRHTCIVGGSFGTTVPTAREHFNVDYISRCM